MFSFTREISNTSNQVHAKRMSDACSLFHSSSDERNGYGENIYYCGGGGSTSCYSAEGAMQGFCESMSCEGFRYGIEPY